MAGCEMAFIHLLFLLRHYVVRGPEMTPYEGKSSRTAKAWLYLVLCLRCLRHYVPVWMGRTEPL